MKTRSCISEGRNHKWVKLKSDKGAAKLEGEARTGIKLLSLWTMDDFLALKGLKVFSKFTVMHRKCKFNPVFCK